MRKADYALFAQIIRKKREDAARAKNGMSERQDFAAMCIEQTAREMAESLAESTNKEQTECRYWETRDMVTREANVCSGSP